VNCSRYGLNVSLKYDDKNDRWLEMSGKKGEWVVAFHGVSNPSGTSNLTNVPKVVLNSIF